MAEVIDRPPFNELDRYAMFTPTPGAENRRAKLAWVVFKSCPRISVSTNNPSDELKTSINAPMSPETFRFFIDQFLHIIKNEPNGTKDVLGCSRGVMVDGKMTGDKVLVSELFFGKDAEGKCWICVKAEGRPEIQFYFGLSEYHSFKTSAGPISEGKMSQMVAEATLKSVCEVITPMTGELRKPLPPRTFGTSAPAKPESDKSFDDIDF